MQNRIHGQFIDTTEMKRVVVSLSKIIPDWISIASIPRGILLRCDGLHKYQIGQIKQKI